VHLVQIDSGYLLAWVGGDEVRTLRLDGTLTPFGSPNVLGKGSSLSMVRAQGRTLIAWVSGDGELQLGELNTDGEPVNAIATIAFGVSSALVSSTGSRALVLAAEGAAIRSFTFDLDTLSLLGTSVLDTIPGYAWSVLPRKDGSVLVSTPADCDGGCRSDLVRYDLDSTGQVVRKVPLTNDDKLQQAVALGTNGTEDILIWSDDRSRYTNLYATTSFDDEISPATNALLSSQILGGQSFPVVAHNDSEFLVMWNQFVPEERTFAAYSRRVGIDGSFRGPPQRLGFRLGSYDRMRAAFGGSGFLVIFGGLSGVRLDANGVQVGEPFPVGEGGEAAVASDGHGYFVVWVDHSQTVYGASITAGGQVLPEGGYPIFPDDAEQSEPTIAWNGSGYVVVWREQPFSGDDEVLRAVELSPAGTTGHSAVVASDPISVESPSLAWDGSRQLLVWGVPSTDEDHCCAWDVRGRFLKPSGDPESNEGDMVIESGVGRTVDAPMPPVSLSTDGVLWSVTWIERDYTQNATPDRLVGRFLPSSFHGSSNSGARAALLGLPVWSTAYAQSSTVLHHTRLTVFQHELDLGRSAGFLTDVLLHLDRARLHPARRP